jgi:hypothetical protein
MSTQQDTCFSTQSRKDWGQLLQILDKDRDKSGALCHRSRLQTQYPGHASRASKDVSKTISSSLRYLDPATPSNALGQQSTGNTTYEANENHQLPIDKHQSGFRNNTIHYQHNTTSVIKRNGQPTIPPAKAPIFFKTSRPVISRYQQPITQYCPTSLQKSAIPKPRRYPPIPFDWRFPDNSQSGENGVPKDW